jgi:hypothetical protein
MAHPIDTLDFWVEDYTPSPTELEGLYSFALDSGKPQELEVLSAEAIRRRVARITEAHAAATKGSGRIYSPAEQYKKGDKVIFAILDGLTGTVEGIRPGNNPHYGTYEVISVTTPAGGREFAAALGMPHTLSQTQVDVSPDEVATRFASIVAPGLATVLGADPEWVHYGHHWCLRGLLPEINVGHLNLAEAVAMLADGPLSSGEFLPELDLPGKASVQTKEFALVLSLSRDARFRNVGALEAPLWALTSQLEASR